MEQTQKRRAERTEEPSVDETQVQESVDPDVIEETDALLDEIENVLEEADEQSDTARSLIDLIDEEADFEGDPDAAIEAIERELWAIGLYVPSDLPQWLQDELGGEPCPYCGCDPCRNAAWLAGESEF